MLRSTMVLADWSFVGRAMKEPFLKLVRWTNFISSAIRPQHVLMTIPEKLREKDSANKVKFLGAMIAVQL